MGPSAGVDACTGRAAGMGLQVSHSRDVHAGALGRRGPKRWWVGFDSTAICFVCGDGEGLPTVCVELDTAGSMAHRVPDVCRNAAKVEVAGHSGAVAQANVMLKIAAQGGTHCWGIIGIQADDDMG